MYADKLKTLEQEHVQCTEEAEQLTWHKVIDVCKGCSAVLEVKPCY